MPETIGTDGRIKDRQGVPSQLVAFRGQRSANGSIASGWTGPHSFDEVFDSHSAYNGSKFQPPVPGYYRFSAMVPISNLTSGTNIEVSVNKNGTLGTVTGTQYATALEAARSDGWALGVVTDIVYLNGTTDYLEVYVYSAVAGTLQGAASEHSIFSGHLVGTSVGVISEPWHRVGAPGEPAYQNGWVAYGAPFGGLKFMKDPHGFVHLGGLTQSGSAATAVMFTLPAGYRPLSFGGSAIDDVIIAPGVANGLAGSVRVKQNGDVYFANGGSTTWCSLDGVTFRAEL